MIKTTTHYDALSAFAASGVFPAEHNDMFNLIADAHTCTAILDLCCGHGLLAERLSRVHGLRAYGWDKDHKALTDGQYAGVRVPITWSELRLYEPASLASLVQFIDQMSIDAVVMRHCLWELFGDDLLAGNVLSDQFADHGVRELFIEGQIKASGFNTLDSELRMFESRYKIAARSGNARYLVRR